MAQVDKAAVRKEENVHSEAGVHQAGHQGPNLQDLLARPGRVGEAEHDVAEQKDEQLVDSLGPLHELPRVRLDRDYEQDLQVAQDHEYADRQERHAAIDEENCRSDKYEAPDHEYQTVQDGQVVELFPLEEEAVFFVRFGDAVEDLHILYDNLCVVLYLCLDLEVNILVKGQRLTLLVPRGDQVLAQSVGYRVPYRVGADLKTLNVINNCLPQIFKLPIIRSKH